jgi:hypothetical protein
MMRDGIAGLMNINRSVAGFGDESRPLRLPAAYPFPRLNRRICAPTVLCATAVALPEMTTDVLDVAAGYAVENVKRDRWEIRSAPRPGVRHWLVRLLGYGHRAARP